MREPEEYVALDLETTGLNPRIDKILEIGAVRIKGGQVQEIYATFVDIRQKIPSFVTELTGITEEMTREGIPLEQTIRELLEFCQDTPVLGHNILFDYSFIKKNAVSLGLTFETKGIDTWKIARAFHGGEQKKSLEALCEHYEISREHVHRAYDDALAAAKLYECLKRDFYQRAPEVFAPKPLFYSVKKECPATKSQKVYLNDLLKYHRIVLNVSMESLTKSEASRLIDGIILEHGRIKR